MMLHSFSREAINELLGQIDRYSCVSFDMFDTLIKRDCYKPTELFQFMEVEIDKKYHIQSHFASLRIFAEREAIHASLEEEITIDEIYNKLHLNLSAAEMENIKSREQDLEYEFCQWNPLMKPVYKYCLEHKKKIVIISDMYLPKTLIDRILRKLGIHYDALFISSEVKKRKSRGGLFCFAMQSLNLKPTDILHVGDNIKSDFLMPKRLGIRAVHIPTRSYMNLFLDKNLYSKSSAYANLCAFIQNHSAVHGWDTLFLGKKSEMDYFAQAGYEAEGPVLYGFVKWLSEQFQKNQIEKVFFLARDGQVMQKAFRKLGMDIPQEYIFASRRALIVPYLWMDADLAHLEKNMKLSLYVTIKSLLGRMGLKYQSFEIYFKEAGFDCLKTYNRHDLLENPKFNEVYEKYIREEVVKNSKEQYNLLLAYMKQIAFTGKVAIVDIGWFGHMQAALTKVVKAAHIPVEIHGYYFGLISGSAVLDGMDAHGYLFDRGHNEEVAEREATFNCIVEALFTADHGTTLGYEKKNGQVVPILDSWEYEEKAWQKDYKKIRAAQEGAMAFIEDAIGTESGSIIFKNIDAMIAFRNWIQLGCYPAPLCAERFGDLHFLDDDIQPFAAFRSGIKYWGAPRRLVRDFVKSAWRVGFLTRAFGTWTMHYWIYKWIRRLAHRVSE